MEAGIELENWTNWEAKELKSHFLSGLESGACSVLMFVISPLWDATAVLPSRLGTGLLMDISLMERYSGQAAATQRMPLCVSLFSFAASHLAPSLLSPLLSLQCSYLSLIYASLTLPPIVFLTQYLPLSRSHPFLSLSPCLSSSLRPSTSLSHTLVATLKTVVTMVTAMCCGNVKEPNPPRITSLFNT